MTEDEIRSHIFIRLAKLYEDPLRRTQYIRFIFAQPDQKSAREVIARLIRNYIVEQIQPGVIRLTDFGYQLIQPDLIKYRMEDVAYLIKPTQPEDLKPPAFEEIAAVSAKLEQTDYVSASLFSGGKSDIYWATKGIEKVTGYSVKELNKAGGTTALIRDSKNQEKASRFQGFAGE